MHATTELTCYALTPSGTGAETFRVKELPQRRRGDLKWYEIRLRDDNHNVLNVRLDAVTARLLGEYLRTA